MKRRASETKSRLRKAAVTAAKVAAALGLLIAVVGFTLLAIWPPINDVTTGATPQYSDLHPEAFRYSQPRVVAAAIESIGSIERFDVVSVDEEAGIVEATAATPSGRFTDDVTVTVHANGEGGAIVFIRSRSRVGIGDMGQNARNIRALQGAMRANLGEQ